MFQFPAARWLSTSLVLLAVFTSSAVSLPAQSASGRQREQFRNAQVLYDWIRDAQGNQLRTFVTRLKTTEDKVPAIFFVGWLSCDSVEYSGGETDGFGAIFWRVIESGQFATVRMDKEGVGESAGNCGKTDFLTELSGYRAAFDSLARYPFIDLDRVFVIGLSNGGGTSPLVAQAHPVRGYLAASSWGRTWYEHMLEMERVRLAGEAGKTPAQVNSALKQFTEFYSLYLIHKMTPGEIIKQHPEWSSLWHDEPDGQYGRPAAFYQQLQDLNLGETWSSVSVPVLVLRGSADTIMSHNDSIAIANSVNRTHSGNAEYVEIPQADHLLSVHSKLTDTVVPAMLEWIKRNLR